MNASMNALVRYPGYLRPLNWREPFPCVLKNRYAALVSSLFPCGGPTAVVFGVAGVVVDSVNRVACRRGGPHVGKEGLKAGAPLVTHDYSSPAVLRVIRAAWVMTSLHHHRPSVVFLGCLATIRVAALSMLQILDASHLLLQAAARLCVPGAKFVCPNDTLTTARALTFPCHSRAPSVFALDIFASTYDKQAAKRTTGKVNKSWHFFTLKWITARSAWQAAVNSFSGATLAKPLYFSRSVT